MDRSGRHASSAPTGRRPVPPTRSSGRHARVAGRPRLREAVAVRHDELRILGQTGRTWAWLLTGVILVVSLATGGLTSVSGQPPPTVALGHPVDAGQFKVSVVRAFVTAPKTTDAFLDHDELTVVADTTLAAKEGTSGSLGVLGLDGVAGVTGSAATVLDDRDGSVAVVNPGQRLRLDYVWNLPPKGRVPASVTVVVNTMDYIKSLPLSGYAGWLPGKPAAQVTVQPSRDGS